MMEIFYLYNEREHNSHIVVLAADFESAQTLYLNDRYPHGYSEVERWYIKCIDTFSVETPVLILQISD